MATAVHFGAGAVGRGFIAEVLHRSGYRVTFVDDDAALLAALRRNPSYTVHEVDDGRRDTVVTGYQVLEAVDADAVVAAIATADLVTTTVGTGRLAMVAPLVRAGLRARSAADPLVVIACENAVNATALLQAAVQQAGPAPVQGAVFADCAVDRIVPDQAGGPDVVIESFHEWVIDRTPFHRRHLPDIRGVTWVSELRPYLERKLYTVNTGHAVAAYHGADRGIATVPEALHDPDVRREVRGALDETKALLVTKHGFTPSEQQHYIETTLARLASPALPGSCVRVAEQPLRKLGRHERLIGPAAQLVQQGHPAIHLLGAVAAALRFDVPADPESVRLQELLRSGRPAADLVREITGVDPAHPLFAELVPIFEQRLAL